MLFIAALASSVVLSIDTVCPLINPSATRNFTTHRNTALCVSSQYSRRVRENLRTTLDGFLADLVLREFLTEYELAVTADRAMEIRGEVLVRMDLKPTFSIDSYTGFQNVAKRYDLLNAAQYIDYANTFAQNSSTPFLPFPDTTKARLIASGMRL